MIGRKQCHKRKYQQTKRRGICLKNVDNIAGKQAILKYCFQQPDHTFQSNHFYSILLNLAVFSNHNFSSVLHFQTLESLFNAWGLEDYTTPLQ